MTDALEEYLTAPRPPKVPRDNPLKDLMTSMNSLPDIYQRYCKDLALKPDPTVMRLLERGPGGPMARASGSRSHSPHAILVLFSCACA